ASADAAELVVSMLLAIALVAEELTTDLAAGELGRVDIGVRYPSPHRPQQFGELTGGDSLPSGSNHIVRRDGAGHGPAGRARRLGGATTQECGDPTSDPDLAEVNMRRGGGRLQIGERQRKGDGLLVLGDTDFNLAVCAGGHRRDFLKADEARLELGTV